jgi:hypothetical protein
VHKLSLPSEVLPGPQLWQEIDPSLKLKLPAGHHSQTFELDSEYDPFEHCIHDEEP